MSRPVECEGKMLSRARARERESKQTCDLCNINHGVGMITNQGQKKPIAVRNVNRSNHIVVVIICCYHTIST